MIATLERPTINSPVETTNKVNVTRQAIRPQRHRRRGESTRRGLLLFSWPTCDTAACVVDRDQSEISSLFSHWLVLVDGREAVFSLVLWTFSKFKEKSQKSQEKRDPFPLIQRLDTNFINVYLKTSN